MRLGRQEEVAGRHLEDAVEQGPHLVPAELEGVVQGHGVPARRHAGLEQRLDLRGEDMAPSWTA